MRFPPFRRRRRSRPGGGIENVPRDRGFSGRPAADGATTTAGARPQTRQPASPRTCDGVERYGDPAACLPNLVCLGINGVEAEPILLALDQRGVAVHSGSSCSSETLEPSPVLTAMGVDADRSLRASVGWSSTDADVDAFLDAFPVVVESLRTPSVSCRP